MSKIGDIGNDEFKNPEVTAVNKFRAAMAGEDEELLNGDDATVLMIKRGDRGIVIINLNPKKAAKISVPVSFADGTYKDAAHGYSFTVKGGVLSGKVPKEKIAVIY